MTYTRTSLCVFASTLLVCHDDAVNETTPWQSMLPLIRPWCANADGTMASAARHVRTTVIPTLNRVTFSPNPQFSSGTAAPDVYAY